MRKFSKVIALTLALSMCLAMFGCGGDTQEPASDVPSEGQPATETPTVDSSSATPEVLGEKVLRYAVLDDCPTIDPQLMNSIPSSTIGYHIYEGLMRNHVGEILPGLAEAYDVSDDGLVYTFHLRDSKWSDGKPITAEDCALGFRRLLDPATASNYAFLGMLVKNAAAVNKGTMKPEELGVKAIDEKTFEVTLEFPAGYFIGMLSMPQFCPVRADYIEQYDKSFALDADKNVYSGPFYVKDWAHEDRMILAKNPNYWQADKINLDEVQVLVVSEPMTQFAMYENGELDVVDVPMELIPQYQDKVTFYEDGANDFMKVNMDGSCILNNKNLRLALNYAFNREEFIMLSTKNVYKPNTRYVLPNVKGVSDDYGNEYPYEAFPVKGDVEKAKAYLADAMKELGYKDPSEITIELLTTDSDRCRTEAEVFKDLVEKALGINIEIKQVPYKQRLDMEPKHEFQLVVSGWVPDYSDPYSYLELWTTESSYNHGSYHSDAYDKYMEDSINLTDPRQRMDALFNAEKTLLEDGGIIPMQLRRNAMLKNEKLTGFETYFVGLKFDYMFADFVA